MLEQPILEPNQGEGHRDDNEILAVKIDGSDLESRGVKPARQHLGLWSVERQHGVGEENRGADRRDQHRQISSIAKRIVDGEIEHGAEQRHACDRDQKGEPVGPAEIHREHDHQIGRHHRELALGEIDDAGRAEDQHEAERDEGVDGADADACEKQLEKEIHAGLGFLDCLGRKPPPSS